MSHPATARRIGQPAAVPCRGRWGRLGRNRRDGRPGSGTACRRCGPPTGQDIGPSGGARQWKKPNTKHRDCQMCCGEPAQHNQTVALDLDQSVPTGVENRRPQHQGEDSCVYPSPPLKKPILSRTDFDSAGDSDRPPNATSTFSQRRPSGEKLHFNSHLTMIAQIRTVGL